MRFRIFLFYILITGLIIAGVVLSGCEDTLESSIRASSPTTSVSPTQKQIDFPKIASWLSKKDEIIASGKPFDLIMTAWVESGEAEKLRELNPDIRLYAGLTLNFVYDIPEWMTFLVTVASYGRETPFEVEESMYLKNPDGSRCAFGWASEEWGHGEIYAMDPRNEEWIDLITSFYRVVLEQPQHDGIIVDMVLEVSWCPEAISNEEWFKAISELMAALQAMNTENKPVIFNAGCRYSDIDGYRDYFDGFLLENLLGNQCGTSYSEALEAAEQDCPVIFAVDTDDTGEIDQAIMRQGLTLSLLFDNTYFTYDVGPRDHGQAWWFPEYEVDLGNPLGSHYVEGNSYRRDFEKGTVVCAPEEGITVEFDGEYTDVSSGKIGRVFSVDKGDGRIFLKT